MFRILVCLFGIIFLGGCAGSAYRLPNISDAEIQATQKKITEDKAPLKIYARSDKAYIQSLSIVTSRLTKNAKPLCNYTGYQSCHFQTMYNAEDVVNAYATDTDRITVYRGLLKYLKNNEEIAAVVAHEMGHHLANHIEEKQHNAEAGAAISGILTAVLLTAANANNPYYNASQQQQDQQTVQNMMNAGAGIGAISYSKEEEREADLLGVYLLSRAGYNLKRAQGIMVVLSKLPGQNDSGRAAFLDSHPAGIERFVAWDKAVEEVKDNPSKLPYSVDVKSEPSLAKK